MQALLDFGSSVKSKDAKNVYYLLTFLTDFSVSLVSAVYSLFLLSKGLDLFQINLVNLAFMAGGFLFEVPTGAYADYFGRRNSVIISNALIVLCLFIYFLSDGLVMFIIAEIVAALAYTFASGSLDAWMVDSLEKGGYVGKVDFVFSQASIISQLAGLTGGLIGAYIAIVNLALPFGIGAVVALSALAVTVLFTNENFKLVKKFHLATDVRQMVINTRFSAGFVLKHPVLFWLTASSTLAMFAFMPLNMYWSPRFQQLSNAPVWLMGWIWAGIALFMLGGSYLAKFLLKKEKSYTWILVTTAVYLAVPILVAAVNETFLVVLSGYLFYEIGRGMYRPTYSSYINRFLTSEYRATMLSFDSMLSRLGAVLGLVILGWVAKQYSIQTAWFVSAFLLLLLIPLYLKAGKGSPPIEKAG